LCLVMKGDSFLDAENLSSQAGWLWKQMEQETNHHSLMYV